MFKIRRLTLGENAIFRHSPCGAPFPPLDEVCSCGVDAISDICCGARGLVRDSREQLRAHRHGSWHRCSSEMEKILFLIGIMTRCHILAGLLRCTQAYCHVEHHMGYV